MFSKLNDDCLKHVLRFVPEDRQLVLQRGKTQQLTRCMYLLQYSMTLNYILCIVFSEQAIQEQHQINLAGEEALVP